MEKEHFLQTLKKKDLLCFVWDEVEKQKTVALVETYCEGSQTPYWTRDLAFKNARPLTKEEAEGFIL